MKSRSNRRPKNAAQTAPSRSRLGNGFALLSRARQQAVLSVAKPAPLAASVTAFLSPAVVLQLLLFVAPMLIIAGYSVLSRGAYGGVESPWTIENYQRLLDPLYGVILLRSVWLAAVSTLLCLVLGFPLALFIARSGRRKNFYLQLVIMPFWTSFLIRTYAWLFLLRDTGLLNTVLQATGMISEPLPLLYNDGAVVLGLVYGYLPFMVLPLYATLERLDPSLLEAAADLGATPWVALWRIVLPLCRPGILAGAILVFIPCLGAYLTPDLMGGGKTIMIGNLVQNQFTTARDWPFGSAISLALMALVMLLLMGAARRKGLEGEGEPLL
ncbi:MAG: ABC transporter permease [Acidobacteria bacterium]|nr:ABC transporter permease [Acidobacteriota bacterium]